MKAKNNNFNLTTKNLTLCALLTALALGLSYLENLFPLAIAIPIPGVKLGLANIITLFALYALNPAQAFMILISRCTLGALFAGNLNALIYSIFGGVSALFVMMILSRTDLFSIYGVSTGGAAAHNCGQIAAAVFTLGNSAPLYYLPVLLFISLFTGALTGLVSALLFRALQNTGVPEFARTETRNQNHLNPPPTDGQEASHGKISD